MVVLIGDFNIDLLILSLLCRHFYGVIETVGCCNIIFSRTRVLPESRTLIDLCITSPNANHIISGILTLDLNDHLPIFSLFSSR